MAHRRGCKTHPDSFCYICGEYTFLDCRKPITPTIKERFYKYFKMKLGDQDKPFAPHIVCLRCSSNLSMWRSGKLKKLPFSTPMSWREQKNHVDDCYFCVTNVAGFNKKWVKNIEYPDLSSAIRPQPHASEDVPPVYKSDADSLSTDEENNSDEEEWRDEDDVQPRGISQQQLDLLVRKLNLSKEHAVKAGSLLKGFGVLAEDTRFYLYRDRDRPYAEFFKRSEQHGFVYCSDVEGLLAKLNIQSDVRNDWWLFTDASVSSIKAVLLHKDNTFPAIPVGYSRQARESYEVIKYLFDLLHYQEYKWMAGGDFKVIAFLTGLQGGYTKHCCFLCLWDSRARADHYRKNKWPSRVDRTPGQANIANEALVPANKILLPCLHIKLGVFKNFVKALDKEGAPMQLLQQLFPKLSAAKIKEGVFVGPDTRRLMQNEQFKEALNPIERRAWEALLQTVQNFLG
jgi:hypothetical protein